MTSVDDRFSKWKEIRKRGFYRFILVRGVLGWGLGAALLYSILMWLVSDQDIHRLLLLALVLFPPGGLVWGAIMWWFIERKYRQQALADDF